MSSIVFFLIDDVVKLPQKNCAGRPKEGQAEKVEGEMNELKKSMIFINTKFDWRRLSNEHCVCR